MDESSDYDSLDEEGQRERFIKVACEHMESFGHCFDAVVLPWLSKKYGFDAYKAIGPSPEQAVRNAVAAAIAAERYLVLKAELTSRPGINKQVRMDALGSADLKSMGQRVMDPGRGMTDVSSLPRLLQAVKAVCLVSYESTPIGTGFLVGRDLILTAAHVLEGCAVSATGEAGDDFLLKTEFMFLNELEQSGGTWPVRAVPAGNWRVAWSPSCINSAAGALIHDGMADQLDFALVRTKAPLPEYVPLIDLRTIAAIPEPVRSAGRYFVLGHPGGRSCVYDTAQLSGVEKKAARVLHGMNTAPGMSGGPLLNAQLYPVGLHEGSVSCVRTRMPLHNRATLLEVVRAQIDSQGQQAYARAVAYPHALFDPGFRYSWLDYGRRAMHGNTVLEQAWADMLARDGIEHDGASLVPGTTEKDYEYPVFPQPGLENWLADEPLQSGQDVLNIVALTGGAGCGKTFAARLILANRQAGEKVFVPETVTGQIPLFDLVRHLAPKVPFNEDWRTHDGTLRNDYLAQILQHYSSLAHLTARGTLTIVVEFGECSYWSEVEQFWRSLLLEGAKHKHLRFILVAPPRGLFEDLMGYEVLAQINLQPPKTTDVLAMAESLGERCAVGGQHARQLAMNLLQEAGRPGRVEERLVAVDAARILIALKRQLMATTEHAA